MKHKIVEKRIDPEIWKNPIPLCLDDIPVLEKEDYEKRLQRLWEMPQTRKFETIVIYGDREHFSNVDYFTGYDVRWEETLLILVRGKTPCLLVGNEGIGYAKKIDIPVNIVFYQTFSLMGQPNNSSPLLKDVFEEHLSFEHGSVGLIGFKAYDPSKHTLPGLVTDVPHYIVETLLQVVPAELVENATAVLADCDYGLKHRISAKEIAIFEAAGTKVSRSVYNALLTVHPGMRETELASNCRFDGSPMNLHPAISFGDANISLGFNSPTDSQKLDLGMQMSIGYGLRGSQIHKVGMYIRNTDDLPEEKKNYVDVMLKPYFDSVSCWYEMMKIGACCGDIYKAVDDELGLSAFGCTLNPSHLMHTDEWTNSPFYDKSTVRISSGMAFQCDYTVTFQNPYMTAHIEDPLVIADEALRKEVETRFPSCWDRIRARQSFMRGTLNIQVPDEVLPLSDLAGVCFPYMADPSVVLTRA